MGPTNTFQAILATDGYRSYVILSYGSLEVELDLFAGFNFGDGLSFVDISTNGIADRSNVLNDETLGRYLYRVNDLPLTTCQTGEIRYTHLQSTSSGGDTIVISLIETCLDGAYGGICDQNISSTTLQVACNSFGFGTASRGELASDFIYDYNGQIILESISCTGNESSLEFCRQTYGVSSMCANTARATKVRCYYPGSGSTSGSGSGSGIGPAGSFLPSGEIANDRVLPSGCNQYSMPISLSPPFVYFGQNQSALYINSNGYFTFGEIFTSCCNVYFPTLSPPLIAVLWRGYNTSRFGGEGSVTYRLTRDPETLDIISNFISERYFPFVPSYAVVATWNMVPTDSSSDFSRYTFQAILASNGRYSFVTFTYGNLDGIRGVQVGFNLGDGYNHGDNMLTNNYLFSSSIDIHNRSNVGIPGVYSFRVDNLTSSFGPTSTPPTDITPTTVTSFTPNSCFDGELRLLTINSTTMTTRNLETFTRSFIVPVICINGTLGYVCDRGWDTEDAAVICRNVFFSNTVAQPVYGVMVNSSLPPVNYAIQDVNCTTDNYNIQNCGHRLADSTVCGAGGSSSIAGVICEELPVPCYEGQFRLSNQTYYENNGYETISGRLEFCQNGTFTPVCSEGFGQMEAQTVCRSMYSQYYDASIFEVNGWPGDVLSSLECNMTDFGGYICRGSTNTCQDPTTVAGVICTEVISQCFSGNGDLRYTNVDTVTNSSGTFTTARVEVCYNGTYGSICDKYVTNETAEFACRERFFATTGRVISSPNLASSPPIVLERIDTCQTAYYCGGANFGITDPDCRNSSRAVGISCSRACFDGDTRIVGGDRYYEGVVEICRNGEWGVICDQGWNDISAAVLCQERGFGAGGSAARYGLSSSRPVVTSNVTCNLRYNPSLSTCLNCTSIPNGCSSQTVAGVRCQPGSLMLNIVPDGIAEYNSSFSLRCNGVQTPYNSTLDSYQWIDSNGPIMDDARRSTRIVPSGVDGFYYRTFFFNTSLDFQGLCVQDAGIYNCSMSINITYPDGPNNSSAIITNTTYYALWIRVPPPDVTLVVPPPPYTANEPFQVSCVVNTVEGVAIRDVNIGWYENGLPITSSFDFRVAVSEVVAINATWFSRTISVSRLIGSDTGNYTCRSSITGLYFYSDEVSIVAALEVEGVPNNASAPLVTAVGSMDQTLLEGESVMITVLIDAIPSVMVGDIQWYFVMFGSNVTINITGSTMLGDGRTQLQFSPNRQSLMLSDVSLSSSGLYFVVASNLAGSGSNFTLITVQTIPQVTLSPLEPFILNDIEDTFTFVGSCSATGVPRPNITWSFTNRENVTMVLSPEFLQINISTVVMNYTVTSVITLANTTIAEREGTITCNASNAVTSVSAMQMPYIAVRAQPMISVASTNVTEGDEVTLTCYSSYSIPPPAFKWTRNGVQLSSSAAITIQNRNSVDGDGLYTYASDLTVLSVKLSDSGNYKCIITQDDSRLSTPLSQSSNVLTLSVDRFDDCEAAGSPCQNGGECIDGDGTYFCQCVGNFDGRNCEISATPKSPSIISGPSGGSFGVESTITLSCIVEGIPTPDISWLFNGLPRADLSPVPNIIVTATLENRGEYACRAQNGQDTVTSSPAFITLNDVQQYNVGLSLSSRRRRQSTSGQTQTIQEIVESTVGAPVGNMSVEIYSAVIISMSADNSSATVLYTLRRPEGVEFSSGVTGALSNTISSSSTAIRVATIARFDACSEEISGGYRWPEASLILNLQIQLPCQCNSTTRDDILPGRATRVCGGSFVTGAVWQAPNTSSCVFDSYVQQICSVSSEEVFNAIASGIGSRSTQSVNLSLSIVADALAAPVTLQTLDGVAEAINALLMGHMDVTFARELRRNGIPFVNNILEQIEDLGNAIGEVSTDQTIKKNLLQVQYRSVPRNRLTTSNKYTVETGSPLVILNSEVAGLFQGNVPLALANIDSRPIGTGSKSSTTISSTLFSVSTGDVQISGLSDSIVILFPKVTDLDNPVACVFWNPQLNFGYGDWSEAGCTVDKTDDGAARCRCNHLSTFGVLYGDPLPPASPPTPTFEVSIIIYVALILSILILLIIVITYLLAEKLRKQAQIVFINTALIGLYIAYIISSLARQFSEHDTAGERICGLFAAILEYFMLVFFCWTTSEALILVLMARNNFKIPRFYFLFSALACYLIPLVIVAISLGGYQYFLSASFCIPSNWPFYFGFVATFVVFALFEGLLYIMAAHSLWNHKSMKHELKLYFAHYITIAAILFSLFIVVWIFGLIGTNNSIPGNFYVAAQYIFSLAALFHSIMTVILHIVRSKEARRTWYRIITCNRYSKRSYSTAGDKPPPAEGTELTQSYTAPSSHPARDDTTLLSPADKTPVENVYSSSPTEATREGDMEADDEHVKVNLGAEESDDDKVVTSL